MSLQLILDFEGEDDIAQIKKIWEEMKQQPNEGILRELIIMYERLWNRDLPTKTSPSAGKRRKRASDQALKVFKWALREPYGLDNLLEYSTSHTDVPKLCRSTLEKTTYGMVKLSHSSAGDYLALKISDYVTTYLDAEDHERPEILARATNLAHHLADIEICAAWMCYVVIGASSKIPTHFPRTYETWHTPCFLQVI